MIIQNVSEAGFTDISFTTPGADLPRAKETMERIVPEIGAREFIVDEDIAKVSLVGTGMKSSPASPRARSRLWATTTSTSWPSPPRLSACP